MNEEKMSNGNSREIKRKKLNQIETKILYVLREANKVQIAKAGFVEYSARHTSSSKNALTEEISQKFLIKHVRTEQDEEGGDFYLLFEVLGQLAAIFDKHKFKSRFNVSLSNHSGEDAEILYDSESVLSLYSSHLMSVENLDEVSLEEVEAFAEELNQFFVMFMLKIG